MSHISQSAEFQAATPLLTVINGRWAGLILTLISFCLGFFPAVAAPGDWDHSFRLELPGRAQAVGLQTDGRMIVWGSQQWLARLRPDGSMDPSFVAELDLRGVASGLRIDRILEQPDGGLLVSGRFPYASGNASKGLTRLLGNGREDATFQLASDSPELGLLALFPDGKMLVYSLTPDDGLFWNHQLTLHRLLPNGEKDVQFQPSWPGWKLISPPQVVISPEGTVLMAGWFVGADPETERRELVKLGTSWEMDEAFNPTLRTQAAGEWPLLPLALAVQPDGKILVGGYSTAPTDPPLADLIRLHADGAVDETFQPETEGSVSSILVQADGRILVRDSRADLPAVRLLANGAKDPDFDAPLMAPVSGNGTELLVIQSDGRLLINGARPGDGPPQVDTFGRLLNSPAHSVLQVLGGSSVRWERGGAAPEVTWVTFETQTSGSAEWVPLGAGTRISGGWELTGVTLPARGSVRARGFTGLSSTAPVVETLALGGAAPVISLESPSGQPLVSGTSVVDCGETWHSRTRVLPLVLRNTGDVELRDFSFVVGGRDAGDFMVVPTPETVVTPQGSETFLVRFRPSMDGPRTATLSLTGAGVAAGPFVISLAGQAGSHLSPTYLMPATIPALAEDFAVAGRRLGEVTLLFEPQPGLVLTVARELLTAHSLVDVSQAGNVVGRFGETTYHFQADYNREYTGDLTLRLIAPGAMDLGFRPSIRGNHVRALVEQADGRVVVGGEFTLIDGHPRTHLARLFGTGALDLSFAPALTGPVAALAVQSDGRILVAAIFSESGGPSALSVVRLQPNGSMDPSFAPLSGIGEVSCLLVQPDGKVLVGGRSWTDGLGWQASLIRLLSDGKRDTPFAPIIGWAAPVDGREVMIAAMALQPDGALLVGGSFGTVNGLPRAGLVRLLPDGRLDETFEVDSLQAVQALGLLPNGRILVVGDGGERRLLRLLPNGDWDPGFSAAAYAPGPGAPVCRLLVLSDGRMLLAGGFDAVFSSNEEHSCAGVVRLRADGSLDSSYQARARFDLGLEVNDLLLRQDGAQWMGKSFQSQLVRLFNNPVSSRLVQSAPSSLLWERSSAMEECTMVEFEAFDAAQAAWRSLGRGIRTGAGWELAEVMLPASGAVRVRGALASGSRGFAGDWLSLGTATPEIVVENAQGVVLPAGSGVAAFAAAPLWSAERLLTVRLRNSGTGVMVPPSVVVAGAQAASFSVLEQPATSLGPQESIEVVLAFKPSGAGLHSAQLAVSHPGQAGGAYVLTVQGVGEDTLSPYFATPESKVDSQWVFRLAGSKFGTMRLGFAPEPGLVLTVLDQTMDLESSGYAAGFDAELAGLPQESEVTAEFGGRAYVFRANYEGGYDWRDLTLTLVGAGTPEIGFGTPEIRQAPWDKRSRNLYNASVAADGSLMIQGEFVVNHFLNEARAFRTDGSPLPSAFTLLPPGGDASLLGHAMEDGGWLVGRSSAPFSPPNRRGFVRLGADWAVVPDFLPDLSSEALTSSFLQPDGRLLVTGSFLGDGNVNIGQSIRLTPEGGRDRSFQSDTSLFYWKAAILGLPDKSVITGQRFIVDGELPVNHLVRLRPDGTRDPSFMVPVADSSGLSELRCLALQADGSILIGGYFDHVGGLPRSGVARLHADGRVDAAFAPTVAGRVESLSVQVDGKIIAATTPRTWGVGGEEGKWVFRLLPDGAVDPTFVARLNQQPFGITLQGDGRVVVAGPFSRVNELSRSSIARLLNDPATESLTVADASTVRWMRGGSAPETHDVWFDVTTNAGETWTRLGAGSRVAGGWELDNPTLPSAGHVRARARVVGGYRNASSSLVESVAVFGREATALEIWRTAHFGTPLNQGAGVDGADPDADGMPNLLEYALGFDPHDGDAAQAPRWTSAGTSWESRLTLSAAAPGVTCSAEWSPNLHPESWQPAEDVGQGTEHLFRVPAPGTAGPSTLFFRWTATRTPAL